MSGRVKCDVCGRYVKSSEAVLVEGEVSDGVWTECMRCLPAADRAFYFPEPRAEVTS